MHFIRATIAVVSLFASFLSLAVTYDSHFNIMYPEKNNTLIHIFNESKKHAHVVSVEVWEINNPMERVPVVSGNNKDILFTPATQLLNPGKDSTFKFIYAGKADDKERYYAVRWRDVSLKRSGHVESSDEHRAVSEATINTSVVTTLIVNPRKNLTQIVKLDNKLKNIGNTMVDMFVNAKCKADPQKDCSTYLPFLPGQEMELDSMVIDRSFSAGYWLDGREAKMLDISG